MLFNVKAFVDTLSAIGAKSTFNPWYEFDQEHDINARAPAIRRSQLEAYLTERSAKTRYLLIGEALSYRGGKFTGLPMMSERIALGKSAIDPKAVAKISFQRTSKPELSPLGFTEPTATIVWGQLMQSGLNPATVCIWNIFPWHPFVASKGPLSNRTPDEAELAHGLKITETLIALLKPKKIITIGEKSFKTLLPSEPLVLKVRHPANGGAGQFRKQFMEIVKTD